MKAIVKNYVGSEGVTLKAFHDEWEVREHRIDVQNLADNINYLQDQVTAWEKQHRETVAYYEHALQQATGRAGRAEGKTASYESGRTCPNCQGWGCNKCCSSEAEIRAKQGIYG